MNFHVLTLFPQMVSDALNHSILKRAANAGVLSVSCVDIRDFAGNKHNRVDDYPYGGGAGMLISPYPVYNAFLSIKDKIGKDARVLHMSPRGKVFDQSAASSLAKEKELVIICGHYEGIDERVIEEIVTDEFSIGDYVLTGGELAALVMIDAVSRLVPGVLPKEQSFIEESFHEGLLEYPQYTRPPVFLDKKVPDVLLSGHHEQIRRWRRCEAIKKTLERRPELIGSAQLTKEDMKIIDEIKNERKNKMTIKKEESVMLEQCEPKNVFKFFEEITRIPRGSGNEKEISDYLVAFAGEKGLWVKQDEYLNVIIKKPGTAGREHEPAMIFQGHMDMVCEKNAGTEHDFEKDPIKLKVEGDYISAIGTTLGADNGTALALCLALLEADDIPHPPLEVLFTSDEEAGMSGAKGVDGGFFEGRRLINLDGGGDGGFVSGSAGGISVYIHLPVERERLDSGFDVFTLRVSGLKGGHSGSDIIYERGNSIRLLGRALNTLFNRFDMYIASVTGGLKENAIPREAEAVVAVRREDAALVSVLVRELEDIYRREYRTSDPNVSLSLEPAAAAEAFKKDVCKRLISAIMILPIGVAARSAELPDVVETSNNIGLVRTEDGYVSISCLTRSASNTRKYMIADQIKLVADMTGGEYLPGSEYPSWEYDPDSKLRRHAMDLYSRMTGGKPVVIVSHGGLECGLFAEKLPGVDMISYGAVALDIHTPEERLSISSMQRTWEFLKTLLSEI